MQTPQRILVIDDNEAIHEDFRKVLLHQDSNVPDAAAAFFGKQHIESTTQQAELSFASQGQDGLKLVQEAIEEDRPFAVAFVDMRMPPGWDGLKTIEEIWKVDSDIQVVICTAYTDNTWKEINDRLKHLDQLLIIKKPFDNSEIRQAASALAEKWKKTQKARAQRATLQNLVNERTTSLREAELTLRERNEHLELAATIANLGYWTYDIEADHLSWSGNLWELHEASQDDFVPTLDSFVDLYHPADRQQIKKSLDDVVARGIEVEFKAAIVRSNGHLRHLQSKIVASPVEDGGAQYLFGITQDVSEFENALLAIKHTALHDPLTELPNRVMFQERLGAALRQTQTSGCGTAIVLIDVDHFKEINDSFGHPAGDQVLRRFASRISESVGPGDTVARLGGDEFAIVMSDADLPGSASRLVSRFFDKLSEPVDVDGQSIYVSASAGISVAPFDGIEAGGLLKNADLALYQAKQQGRATFRFFELEMDSNLRRRRKTEAELRRAIARNELQLFYQPLVDAESRQLTCLEALIRWNHPERGVVPPVEFIPLAEESGLIVPIGAWVLRQACMDAATWPSHVSVAVNVSAVQFDHDSLLTNVMSALAASGLDPKRLELEITETVFMRDTEDNLAVLRTLKDQGVRIVMDDFGVGYSSLSYLRSFPFDKLKLDQSFVRDAIQNDDSRAIVAAVAGLGANLGMVTTAEGVEEEVHLQQVVSDGYSQLQGYLFGKPMPHSQIESKWLSDGDQNIEVAAQTMGGES